ncbi:MAG: type II secretion system protein GspK [Cellvibrionaceae bacterium]|nr:type II secretion system protein GspK [Cellvibrionaceae bacterium]
MARFFLGSKAKQQGVALIMVLWLVAAMSLLVAGVIYSARMDTKQTQRLNSMAKYTAMADGVSKLALRSYLLWQQEQAVQVPYEWTSDQYGVVASVSIVPTKGLIDLNTAGFDALFQLFSIRLGLDEEQASILAQNLIDWRRPVSSDFQGLFDKYEARGLPMPRHGRLFSVADLLAIDGFNLDMMHLLEDVVYVDRVFGGGVDPVSAPAAVLSVLSNGNEEAVLSYLEMREQSINEESSGGSTMLNSTEFSSAFLGQGSSTIARLDVDIEVEQVRMLRRLWVDTSGYSAGLPWEVVRAEPMRIRPQGKSKEMPQMLAANRP